VVQRLAAAPRRIDGNLNIFFDAFLPDVFIKALGPHAHFDARVFVKRLPGHYSLWLSLWHHPLGPSIRHLFAIRRAPHFFDVKFGKSYLASFMLDYFAVPDFILRGHDQVAPIDLCQFHQLACPFGLAAANLENIQMDPIVESGPRDQ